MDEQDKDFEIYLRQFHLRQHAPYPAEISVEVASRRPRWVLAAVAAAVVAAISLPLARNFITPDSFSTTVEVAGDSTYTAGETIAAGRTIHSGGFKTLVMRLEDGSQVEMRPQSQIVFEPAEGGSRIRLNSGSIVVRAAKQRAGHHLYVQTIDTTVSVMGTVFLVQSLEQGTRVAVLEGEVEVQFGTEVQKLAMGRQISSSSEVEPVSIEELIAWSREARPPINPVVAEPPEETAGLRAPAPEPLPVAPARGGRRGGGGLRGRGPVQSQQQDPQAPPPPPQQPPEQGQQPQADAGANGTGKDVFYRACVACHSDEVVKNRQWPNRETVASRVPQDVAYGARLSQQETQAVIDFIWTTWGARAK